MAAARSKGGTAMVLAAVVVGMAGLSFAAVPLYDLFCRVTGFGGTTQVDSGAGARAVLDRQMTVRFNADVVDALAWSFQPVERAVEVQVGENALTFYRAESRASRPTTGTATFNVTPAKAGQYFVKLDCFASRSRRWLPARQRTWRCRSTLIRPSPTIPPWTTYRRSRCPTPFFPSPETV